jgi:hypothetical protein
MVLSDHPDTIVGPPPKTVVEIDKHRMHVEGSQPASVWVFPSVIDDNYCLARAYLTY